MCPEERGDGCAGGREPKFSLVPGWEPHCWAPTSPHAPGGEALKQPLGQSGGWRPAAALLLLPAFAGRQKQGEERSRWRAWILGPRVWDAQPGGQGGKQEGDGSGIGRSERSFPRAQSGSACWLRHCVQTLESSSGGRHRRSCPCRGPPMLRDTLKVAGRDKTMGLAFPWKQHLGVRG